MQITKLMTGISCCFMMSGCSPFDDKYYIPVDNQVGDASPLSKDDVIRVVIPHDFPIYLNNSSHDDGQKDDWKWMDYGMYN